MTGGYAPKPPEFLELRPERREAEGESGNVSTGRDATVGARREVSLRMVASWARSCSTVLGAPSRLRRFSEIVRIQRWKICKAELSEVEREIEWRA